MEHGDFSSHTRCHPTPINIHAVTKIRHSKASFPTHAGTNAGEDPIIRSHPKLRLIILTKSSFHHTTKSTTEHSHFVNLYLVSHVRHERTELVDNPVVDGRRHRLSLTSLKVITKVIEMKSPTCTKLRGSRHDQKWKPSLERTRSPRVGS